MSDSSHDVPLHKVPGPLKTLLSEFYGILAIPSRDWTQQHKNRVEAILNDFPHFSHDPDCKAAIDEALLLAMEQQLQPPP